MSIIESNMKLDSGDTRSGFTLIEFMVVVLVVAMLVLLFLPGLRQRPRPPHRLNCVNNLKQIGLSFRQWALDNNDKLPMQVSVTNGGTMELIGNGDVFVHFLVMSNEFNTPKVLVCPSELDSKRKAATSFSPTVPARDPDQIPFTSNTNVSYFVGVDADQLQPQMLLAGDDNFTVSGKKPEAGLLQLRTNSPVKWTSKRHGGQGNVSLADGSVQMLDDQALKSAFQASGMATNRLAMP